MQLGFSSSALSAFRSRDFRLLWGGQTVSFAGDMAFLVAIGWYVTTLTGSAGSLGIVLAIQSAALLTTLLIGGVIADRYPRRRLMIGSDLARAVLVGILAALDATGSLSFTAILVLVALIGLADGFFQPAFGGIVPLVVEQPFLASANSMLNVARQTAAIGGPALAALVYGTAGSTTVFALDAASFVFSAALLWLARPRRLDAEPTEGPWRDLAAGFRYVASVPWLWSGILVTTLILMVAMTPYQSLLPRLVRTHFHLGIGAYGLLFSLQAVGMVLGSFTYAHVNPRRKRAILCFAAFSINDAFMLLLAVSPWFPLAAARLECARLLHRRRDRALDDDGDRARAGGLPLAGDQPRLLRLVRADAGRLPRRGRARGPVRAAGHHRRGRDARRAPLAAAARERTRARSGLDRPRAPPTAPDRALLDRGAQIRTGDLSDPNGARYQAAPHPERA